MATMIKFRAWDKVQNKMLLPDNIEFINGQAYWAEASTDGNGSYSNDGKVDGIGALFEGGIDALFDVEQFTGLKDTSGDEIYENDLVRLTDDLEDPIYRVVFDEAKFEIVGGGVCYDLGEEFMDCEVIGNVHENPELLEEDK